MSTTYELEITYTYGRELASWNFNHEGVKHCCEVEEGDVIHVTFNGPGDVAERVMLCGQMEVDKKTSPFVEGNQIDLRKTSTLQVGQQDGKWGFSIAFTARNADATTSFYYVPDPELIVKTRPGSND